MSDHAGPLPDSESLDPFDGLDELQSLQLYEHMIILGGTPTGLAFWSQLPLAEKLKLVASYRAMRMSQK